MSTIDERTETVPDLAPIEARANAATPGPWNDLRVGRDDGTAHARSYEAQLCNSDGTAIAIVQHDGSHEGRANIEFAAHARTDIPALIAYARRMQAQFSRLRAAWQRVRPGVQEHVASTMDQAFGAPSGTARSAEPSE